MVNKIGLTTGINYPWIDYTP